MSSVLKMRPADPDDEPFLRQLREEVDRERLFLHTWPDQVEAKQLLDMQFNAHSTHHREADVDKKDVIVEVDGTPIGRFIVTQTSHEIRLADIEVARAYRGRGIGEAVIEGIKGESIQSKRPIRLLVDKHNAARQFYQNQGFKVIETLELDYLMQWSPPTLPGAPQYFFGSNT